MLVTQTLEKLRAMRLDGMVQALEEQNGQADISQLDFESRLSEGVRGGSSSFLLMKYRAEFIVGVWQMGKGHLWGRAGFICAAQEEVKQKGTGLFIRCLLGCASSPSATAGDY